ncbi:HpcH/HpaI aldolase family protein [Corynebacterium pseudopelargi]|uniref:4-hydroxy-2-oxo-heptane-1,7-dioate aldolase n=1 Tax=Corynebacterium pseudopelargi TaxID=2080757 RepID=A0A3G6IVD8_9CORY|nr:aldolase/citrate lyase family protein [Corynebacterium pseudopelargi]AZA09755.1 4-hydroxy-2-oxo-heptane-1,7-dioate aldolase [Corynebacterium pseudopelargi]
MQIQVDLPPTFNEKVRGTRGPATGLWVCSGSDSAAEILSLSGAEWLLIDGEHSPVGLETITSMLRAVAAGSATPVVRVPVLDTTLIKQYLDLGAQNIMVPMVHTGEDAAHAVAAMHYPPKGIRGVGSALARSSRWNRVSGYLDNASETVSLTVQIESDRAVRNCEAIANTDGVDAVFIGPSDLAASMGLLGKQTHPDVLERVYQCIDVVQKSGKLVGVNAFDLDQAREYVRSGVDFVAVGADVQILASQSQVLANTFKDGNQGS